MKNSSKYLFLILMIMLLLPLDTRQTEPRMDYAPKPPGGPSRVLLDNWNEIGRKLIAMAEDFPEDKYDFKPTPAQRSFAEQLLHAAGANYFFINPVKGVKPPSGDPKRSEYKTKAAVVEFVKQSFADGAVLIKSKGDGGLNDLWVDPFSNRTGALFRRSLGLYGAFRGALRTTRGVLPCSGTGAAGVAAQEIAGSRCARRLSGLLLLLHRS